MTMIKLSVPDPQIKGGPHREYTDDPQVTLACARDVLGDGAAEVACPNPSCRPEGEEGPEIDAHLIAVNVLIPDNPEMTPIGGGHQIEAHVLPDVCDLCATKLDEDHLDNALHGGAQWFA